MTVIIWHWIFEFIDLNTGKWYYFKYKGPLNLNGRFI